MRGRCRGFESGQFEPTIGIFSVGMKSLFKKAQAAWMLAEMGNRLIFLPPALQGVHTQWTLRLFRLNLILLSR